MGLTEFALRNSRLTLLLTIAVVILGVTAYLTYPRQEDPTITIREAIVTAAYPGMSSTRVEDLITRPLEEAVRELPEVKTITSDSKTGISVVHVTARDEITDVEGLWQDLRNKMDDMARTLPDGTRGPVINDNVGLTSVATIALWTEGFSLNEMYETARDIRDSLYTLDGIKKVEIFGAQDERIFLNVRTTKLAQYGISPGWIIDTLRSQNIILPGGAIKAGGQRIMVQPSGNYESLEDIRGTLIAIPGGQAVVPLRDVVEVERGFVDPPDKPVFFNGRQALVLSVSISTGVNSVAFGERLTRHLNEIERTLPIGYVIDYATYQPALVERAVSDAVLNVYQTLIIVLGVVMIFLGWRTGLIVGAIVPLSMLAAIVIMRAAEIELQRISIASMIIALGLLVDNGIVVAEDIRRRLESGERRQDAAINAGKSLAVPLLTSSLTTILAFMPMMLAVGAAGEYTRSLSLVIMIVLLSSWILAMTVTPAACLRFLQVRSDGQTAASPYDTPYYRLYRRTLTHLLGNRILFLVLMAALFIGAVAVFQSVRKDFFPPSDRNQFLVYIDLPAGSRIDETARIVQSYTRWLKNPEINPEVDSAVGYAGDGGPRFFLSLTPIDPDPHAGFVVVTTADNSGVQTALKRTRAYFRDTVPEARARAKTMWLGNSETGLLEIRAIGADGDAIFRAGQEIEGLLRTIEGTINIRNDWENPVLKIHVRVDQSRARRAGVTSEEIANSLSAFLDGAAVSEYRDGRDSIPITIRGTEDERQSLSFLPSINVYAPATGRHVPLSQIARFEPEFEFGRIKRRDQARTLTIEAKHRYLKAGELLERLRPDLESLELGPGIRLEIGGEIEKSAEAQANLFKMMPFALIGIILLLVWQFNSFRRPAIILLTIPLSFIGSVAGLVIMQASFGFMAILGLFSLAGIIINNGIVLIDRIDQERAAGKSVRAAILDASQARLRPILITTITTVLGLLPLIFFGGALWYAMANVIAFGLALGTVLTLGVVPVLYGLFFGDRRDARRTVPEELVV